MKVKLSEHARSTPANWDPLTCGPRGEDKSHILPPAALRLFEAEVDALRKRQRAREEAEWDDD